MRDFNTEGPINREDHYYVQPLDRFDLAEVLHLVERKKSFILHAPRQSGKTSTLLALQDLLNSGTVGSYRCVHINVEAGQAFRENVPAVIETVLDVLAERARIVLHDDHVGEMIDEVLAKSRPGNALAKALARWSRMDPRPLVLMVDEIDALVGDALISVLRQLRSGYEVRPDDFPHSVVLCGVRNIRDYRVHSGSTGEGVLGGSAFNVSAKSLRLNSFSRDEVAALVGQHTAETGQAFEPEALDLVWSRTRGQPWLVNALCQRTCFERASGRDRRRAVAARDVLEAQESLILERVVHLDQLAHKLREERVRRVIEPLLSGARERHYSDLDLEYVRDLGLVARDAPVRMANPIYAEVVPRQLTHITQEDLLEETAWYVDAAGGLDLAKLLESFQRFYREHSEHWIERYQYKEAGPQLLLQAFLQRVVNGGGRIEREYGLGRRRTDLLIKWPREGSEEQFVVECKLVRGSLETTLRQGLAQTAGYMDRCGAQAGHLVVFDRSDRPWEERIFHRTETAGHRSVEVWGM